jgi:hypothetical protein
MNATVFFYFFWTASMVCGFAVYYYYSGKDKNPGTPFTRVFFKKAPPEQRDRTTKYIIPGCIAFLIYGLSTRFLWARILIGGSLVFLLIYGLLKKKDPMGLRICWFFLFFANLLSGHA